MAEEVVEAEFLGKKVQIRRPSDTQMAVLFREVGVMSALGRADDVDQLLERGPRSVKRLFDLLGSTIVDPEVYEEALDRMADGRLELSDFFNIIRSIAPAEAPRTGPAKRVRRARS